MRPFSLYENHSIFHDVLKLKKASIWRKYFDQHGDVACYEMPFLV